MPEHQKDFDGWNERKKELNYKDEAPYFEEREIWWCSLGMNIGFEQDGSSRTYQRPILVLKKWSKDTCLALPLTSSDTRHFYRISVGAIRGIESCVIISQAKTIDARRLTEKMATLGAGRFEYIRKTIKEYL